MACREKRWIRELVSNSDGTPIVQMNQKMAIQELTLIVLKYTIVPLESGRPRILESW